ncbi:MAG: MreB/Mrl family cell shape determining protein [Actinobacteria bacterium]|nr:MreB/Mrl family cell shape determining protein [Actinomycetota bacterium]
MKFNFSTMFSNDLAIDLGTANTLVFLKNHDIVLNEPSVVAIRKNSQEIVAFGDAAKEMVGRTPGEIITVRPLKDGVIADFELAEQMIRHFIRKAVPTRIPRPRIAICVPSGITEVEKRAVRDSAEHAGAREVYLIDEPMAAAIGLGLPIDQPVGSMIIDIGGGTTEIAVIAMHGIVNSISIRIGGDEMNDAIIQYFKKTFNLLIGENTAELIKCKFGSASPHEGKGSMPVKGRDLVVGIPKTVTINALQVQEALSETVNSIVESVKLCLETTPPELSADILDRGILMSGGGSQLKGLDERLRRETNLPVIVSEEPLLAVVRGTGKVLEDLNSYRKVLTQIRRY